MTNKEGADDEGENVEPRLVSFLALHLVSQILDEAYIIANAAKDSGQPWRYLTILKNLRSGKLGDPDDEDSFAPTQASRTSQVEYIVNNLATSTPQKLPDEVLKALNESSMEQGEEVYESSQSNLSKATSMFINHLFDMSEVEHLIFEDSVEMNIEHSETYDVKNVSMHRIVMSCVDTALDLAAASEEVIKSCKQNLFKDESDTKAPNSNDDALKSVQNVGLSIIQSTVNESGDAAYVEATEMKLESTEKDNISIYERAYLTLNRDEENLSEDDTEIEHTETKGLAMQNVELLKMTDNDRSKDVELEKKFECPVDAAEAQAIADPRKGSLANRCRKQGTRILARLRGWWRRKTPGRRMEYQVQRAARDICPSSPGSRQRVGSLRGQRHLTSPSTSRSVLWKFNTVNEGLVNSSHWKYKYELKSKSDDCPK